MQTKIITVLQWLTGFLLILLFLTIPVTLLYPGQDIIWYRSFLIVIPVVISAVGIERFKHLAVYLLVMLVTIAVMFFAGRLLPEKIYLAAASLLVFLIRVPARLNDTTDVLTAPAPVALLFFGLVYIISLAVGEPEIADRVYRVTFVFLIDIVLYTNLTAMSDYLKTNREMANLPGKQILRTNRTMLTIFSVIMVGLMVLLPVSGINRLMARLWEAFRRFIASLQTDAPDIAETIVEEVSPSGGGGMDFGALGEDTTPQWVKDILNGLAYVLAAVVICLALYFLVKAIIQMFHQFYRPIKENNDQQEFIEDEKPDISAKAEREKREGTILNFFRTDMQIRRAYKKAVKRGFAEKKVTSEEIAASSTPIDLETGSGLSGKEGCSTLHELYEKARYSGKDCTREDLERLKKAGF